MWPNPQLQIWSHLLEKSLTENFFFGKVVTPAKEVLKLQEVVKKNKYFDITYKFDWHSSTFKSQLKNKKLRTLKARTQNKNTRTLSWSATIDFFLDSDFFESERSKRSIVNVQTINCNNNLLILDVKQLNKIMKLY